MTTDQGDRRVEIERLSVRRFGHAQTEARLTMQLCGLWWGYGGVMVEAKTPFQRNFRGYGGVMVGLW